MSTNPQQVRLDKWLWAARFFKTRSLAAQAVNGGKVHLNGSRSKAARLVKEGDRLQIQRGQELFVVSVLAVNSYRRPAKEARLLYEEEPESIRAREEQRAMRQYHAAGQVAPSKRPGKRDRRKIKEFIRKG